MSANAAPIFIKSESLQRELSIKVFINPLSCYRPVSIMVQHHHLPDARYIRTVKCMHGISVRAQEYSRTQDHLHFTDKQRRNKVLSFPVLHSQ